MMDLTFGGPRDAVASHKHGARARLASTVHAFWVVLEGRSSCRAEYSWPAGEAGQWTVLATVVMGKSRHPTVLGIYPSL
jgi:hypothetical protein